MKFSSDELWIEQQIMRRTLSPAARGMSAAEAARQYNEANALTTTDPAYLVPPVAVVNPRTGDEPRVWIGCLQCYNEGRLIGDWYPAADAAEVTTSALHGRPIARETHEELWVMDHENLPVRSEMSPSTATVWAEVLDGVPEHEREPFDAWVLDRDWHTDPAPELVAEFEEKYTGEWQSMKDFAYEYVASAGLLDHVPDEVRNYFDFDAYARDLEHSYDVIKCPGGVYVFHQN